MLDGVGQVENSESRSHDKDFEQFGFEDIIRNFLV